MNHAQKKQLAYKKDRVRAWAAYWIGFVGTALTGDIALLVIGFFVALVLFIDAGLSRDDC